MGKISTPTVNIDGSLQSRMWVNLFVVLLLCYILWYYMNAVYSLVTLRAKGGGGCSMLEVGGEWGGGGGGVSLLVSSVSNCLLIPTYAKTNLLQHKDWFVQIALKTAKASLI